MNISEFEKQTSYCPLYLAWRIVDEARDYFRTPIPEAFADQLARRAEAVFAHQPFWQRKYQSVRGREYILMSMRHWLAGVLARERPALFCQLPEGFKVGLSLPTHALTRRASALACHKKSKTTGLTCRSASISQRRGSRGRSPHQIRMTGKSLPHGIALLTIV